MNASNFPKKLATIHANQNRHIDVEIGDTKESLFYPQLKIKHWNNETNFSIRLADGDYPSADVSTDTNGKSVWKRGHRTARIYAKDTGDEDGGHEFEVEFASKPASNVVEFTLQTKGLDFFYQPALTQAEIEAGQTRPDNIVGSYAVYHSTKKNNTVGGTEYRTGKAFHIYRPFVTDANGVTVWCDLNIDAQSGIATITIPQTFLDTATYPILVDPTFGYTTAGATAKSLTFGNGSFNGIVTSPSDVGGATINSLTASCNYTSTSNIKGVIWDNSTGYVITNAIGNAVAENASQAWTTSIFSTSPSLTASYNYIIGFVNQNGSNGYYDTATGYSSSYQSGSNNYTSPTTNNGFIISNARASIYVTYTAGGTTTTKTETGVARVIVSTAKTITGKSRIQISTARTIVGTSRIGLVTAKTLSGVSRITIKTTKTETGTSRITTTATKTTTGTASISSASVGPDAPATAVSDPAVGSVAWMNPTYAEASDGSYATATLTLTPSEYLKLTNFGFAIPTGSTINGIVVEVQRANIGSGTVIDNAIRIVKSDGSIGTTDKSSATAWPSSEAYATYGGAGDLWGETWTATDINNSNFGVAISAQT